MFVLTHRPPARITITRSGDLSDAVATATAAAAGKDVIVFGANLAVQCLRAGLLDEIVIHLVPVLLGSGVRLIDTPDFAPVALERTLVDFWSGDRSAVRRSAQRLAPRTETDRAMGDKAYSAAVMASTASITNSH